ncbi:hypothetical protein C8R44DRAFT_720368 [Mycena epipterygia]|nr:hypothetical protein C8R44DRAFT_720368 [Mycena epipterygia]
MPNETFYDYGWRAVGAYDDQYTPIYMEKGWSRFHSSSVNRVIEQPIYPDTNPACWLSQANYIFSQLATPPKYEDCVLIYRISYSLSFSGPSEYLPDGYLFLCPLEDLQDDTGKWISNPECPAYWSLDPSGSEKLSPEEASSFGFPSPKVKMYIGTRAWDENIYAALTRFHAGKGFDPNSKDIAQHLGFPLYEIYCSPGIDSARIKEVIYSDPSGAQDKPITTIHDALSPQKLKSIVIGALVLTLIASWSHKYLRRVGE